MEARLDDYSSENRIYCLRLLTNDGQPILDKSFKERGNTVTQCLRKDEAIIGVYGVRGKRQWLSSLGFVVWDTGEFKRRE